MNSLVLGRRPEAHGGAEYISPSAPVLFWRSMAGLCARLLTERLRFESFRQSHTLVAYAALGSRLRSISAYMHVMDLEFLLGLRTGLTKLPGAILNGQRPPRRGEAHGRAE